MLWKERHIPKVELGIAHFDPEFVPGEFLRAEVVSRLLVAYLHHPFLLLVEKVCGGRVVGQSEPDPDGHDHTEQAFDDIHPSTKISVLV